MALLVSAGNVTFAPLGSVIGALQKKNIVIDAVWLIDNQQTVASFTSNVTGIKNALGRQDVMVASLEVTEQNAADRIPEFMADYVLRNKSGTHHQQALDKGATDGKDETQSEDSSWREDVIVDLTAGPKFITSTLYAAANFCRVKRVYYFLLKNRAKQQAPFSELTEDDYEYLQLPPFSDESLVKLGQRSYLQIVYYMKEIEELAKGYRKRNISFADRIEQSLHFAIRGYFDGDYEGAIRSASSLLETWSEHLYLFCETHEQEYGLTFNHLDEGGRKWNNYNAKLHSIFKDLVNLKKGEQHSNYQDAFVNDALKIIGTLDFVESARKLRNAASHSVNRRFKTTEADANLLINIALSTMKRSCDTIFFSHTQDDDS